MENVIKQHAASVRTETAEGTPHPWSAAEKNVSPNRFANLWLLILGLIMALTLLCTGILVAWPILARIASKLN